MIAPASFASARKGDYTPADLRALLKSNLGLNSRQVTVSKRSSMTYLQITVRDPSVDIAAVRAFAKSCDTWVTEMDDCCHGQSVHVDTTPEVDAVHAAPFIEEIRATIPRLDHDGGGLKLSNGKILWRTRQGYYVTAGDERGCYLWPYDVRAGAEWAISALALQAARV